MNNTDHKNSNILPEEKIISLTPEELEEPAGGSANEVKCPICKRYFPIRAMKMHLRDAHGRQNIN